MGSFSYLWLQQSYQDPDYPPVSCFTRSDFRTEVTCLLKPCYASVYGVFNLSTIDLQQNISTLKKTNFWTKRGLFDG